LIPLVALKVELAVGGWVKVIACVVEVDPTITHTPPPYAMSLELKLGLLVIWVHVDPLFEE
jgi:hypothetical protein